LWPSTRSASSSFSATSSSRADSAVSIRDADGRVGAALEYIMRPMRRHREQGARRRPGSGLAYPWGERIGTVKLVRPTSRATDGVCEHGSTACHYAALTDAFELRSVLLECACKVGACHDSRDKMQFHEAVMSEQGYGLVCSIDPEGATLDEFGSKDRDRRRTRPRGSASECGSKGHPRAPVLVWVLASAEGSMNTNADLASSR
jgi:hypothetical protein